MKTWLAAAAILFAGPVAAQEPETPPADSALAAPLKPKPRPKPKPKAVPRAETGAAASRTAAPAASAPSQLRSTTEEPSRSPTDEPASPSPSPSRSAFAAPLVACDPGQSVLYDGPKAFSLWVTRIGSVTVDNPLRPLTPDVTRVLQLVIGDKLATAYGRDLTALRRGASPAALESLLGGPIRWEARLGNLPDAFAIVSDSGAPLAQMRFKECGSAPAAKAPPAPVAKRETKPRASKKAPAADQAGSPPPASLGRSTASPGPTAVPPRPFSLPQGALSE